MFEKATNMLIFKRKQRFCTALEIIPDRASVYTQERFSGVISIRSDLTSWRVIYWISVHTMNIAKVSLYFR